MLIVLARKKSQRFMATTFGEVEMREATFKELREAEKMASKEFTKYDAGNLHGGWCQVFWKQLFWIMDRNDLLKQLRREKCSS